MNHSQLELPGFSPNSDANATSSVAVSSLPNSGRSRLGSKLLSAWRAMRPWMQLIGVIVSVLSALYITIVTTTAESKTVDQIKLELATERDQLVDHESRLSGVESDTARLKADVHTMTYDLGQIRETSAANKALLEEVKSNVRLLVERALER